LKVVFTVSGALLRSGTTGMSLREGDGERQYLLKPSLAFGLLINKMRSAVVINEGFVVGDMLFEILLLK